ncbi:hypothetical protein KIW84_044174 [Lathyrus oleraceus]|uniref:Arabidopsis retrotransposon Orf1 C-terminal domain-containing protein n=1 Tax=Pisum sativum TaxID=3888 RepID=A0A9D4XFZ0_PEA|nr:hypothetical protein KIW84_044174 [Pisum sativum]
MEGTDNMQVIFRNEAQRSRYEVLATRTISPTRYLDFPSLIALGLSDSVKYMFNQLIWNRLSFHKHPTYKNLTLEFLSSYRYKPNVGIDRVQGFATFRLFRKEYRLTQNELVGLLAFQCDPQAYTELPTVAAQTFLGKAKNIGAVSKEEVFLIFSIFQSRSEHFVAFLTENLAKIIAQVVEDIHVGGIITHIAIALATKSGISNLYDPIEILWAYIISYLADGSDHGVDIRNLSDTPPGATLKRKRKSKKVAIEAFRAAEFVKVVEAAKVAKAVEGASIAEASKASKAADVVEVLIFVK